MPKLTVGGKLNLAPLLCMFIPTEIEWEQETPRKVYWTVVGFVQIGAVTATGRLQV
jgi:hypothetical protein